jgi:hypothetical protein
MHSDTPIFATVWTSYPAEFELAPDVHLSTSQITLLAQLFLSERLLDTFRYGPLPLLTTHLGSRAVIQSTGQSRQPDIIFNKSLSDHPRMRVSSTSSQAVPAVNVDDARRLTLSATSSHFTFPTSTKASNSFNLLSEVHPSPLQVEPGVSVDCFAFLFFGGEVEGSSMWTSGLLSMMSSAEAGDEVIWGFGRFLGGV